MDRNEIPRVITPGWYRMTGPWKGARGEICWGRDDAFEVGPSVKDGSADPNLRVTRRAEPFRPVLEEVLGAAQAMDVFDCIPLERWTIVARWLSREGGWGGRCEPMHETILLNIRPNTTPVDLRVTFLHELVHAAGWVHHQGSFRDVLSQVCMAADVIGRPVAGYSSWGARKWNGAMHRAARVHAAKRRRARLRAAFAR